MKTKRILMSLAILLMLAGSFFSCEKKDENCFSIPNVIHDESASILGRWKLIKTMHPMSGQKQVFRLAIKSNEINITF